jgi:hypothetical protein
MPNDRTTTVEAGLTEEELNATDLPFPEWKQQRESLENLLYETVSALLSMMNVDTIELEGMSPYFYLKITTLTPEQQNEREDDTAADRTLN